MVRIGESSETMMPVMIETREDTSSGLDNALVGLNQVIVHRTKVIEAVRICKCSNVILICFSVDEMLFSVLEALDLLRVCWIQLNSQHLSLKSRYKNLPRFLGS